MNQRILQAMAALLACWGAHAQVNSGSNGSDGAFNPTTNIVINMADHPDGIYNYTSVNISNGVTVTFIPNANNTPVVWLVQSDCVINGVVNISGQAAPSFTQPGAGQGGEGGPGGFRGGNGGISGSGGQGPGGGAVGGSGEPAAFATIPFYCYNGCTPYTNGSVVYGNQFLIPLVGGSGGGGATNSLGGGGGGGGALLIAASQTIQFNGGGLNAYGGGGASVSCGYSACNVGGGGSGGAIRLVAARIAGTGSVNVDGGGGPSYYYKGGLGRVRFDTLENNFSGPIYGSFTQGFQPVLFPTPGQGAQLTITSVGGVPVSGSPSGQLVTPDAVLSAQQNNPISIIVHCSNIPLNSQITVSVKPANGAAVSATGLNNSGTLSSSTATIPINMPRGGGIIYATAAN